MLNFWWKKMRKAQRGFTLIELVVVLAILGILIALAVPRYLGARKSALIAEGDNLVQEVKTLTWAYYQQYSTFEDVTLDAIGFQGPAGACWTMSFTAIGDGPPPTVTIRATSNPAGRAQCAVLGTGAQINLVLNGDGSSTRTTTGL